MGIKDLRREANLTQEQLARKADVTVAAIQKWERNGIARAQVAAIAKVARALNKSIEELLEG